MNPRERAVLEGKHILIVEDEPLIALDLGTVVNDFGGLIVGPAATFADAMRLVDFEPLDGAILDVRLSNMDAGPVARRLAERNIPFVVHAAELPTTSRPWPPAPTIAKPARAEDVVTRLAALIQRPQSFATRVG